MRTIIVTLLVALLAAPAIAAEEPKNDNQKTLYALGVVLADKLAVFDLTSAEFEIVKQGLSDAVNGKTSVTTSVEYGKKIQELASERRAARGVKLAADAKAFIEKTEKETKAVKTKSGLIFIPKKEGSGMVPTMNDTVKVTYRGTMVDGKEFDSSSRRDQPTEVAMKSVIKCWAEGLQMMKVGGAAKLVCPPELAYGDKGAGGVIPPDATLVFEVELLDAKKEESLLPPGHGMGHGM